MFHLKKFADHFINHKLLLLKSFSFYHWKLQEQNFSNNRVLKRFLKEILNCECLLSHPVPNETKNNFWPLACIIKWCFLSVCFSMLHGTLNVIYVYLSTVPSVMFEMVIDLYHHKYYQNSQRPLKWPSDGLILIYMYLQK